MNHEIPDHVKSVISLFRNNSVQVRMAGGCVRDTLLGVTPKDWDLCTSATPERVVELAESHGLRTMDHGMSHGTVAILVSGEVVEVTTLRVDKECDGRHAVVEFTDDWEADAKRRDLTVNALMMDEDGEVYDYVGGVSDLENRVVRFVGDPSQRIKEDYLRILRFFRFAARFEVPSLDEESLRAVTENVAGLAGVSGERKWLELSKILSSPAGVKLLPVMGDCGLWEELKLPPWKWTDLSHASGLALTVSQRGASHLGVVGTLFCPYWITLLGDFCDSMKVSSLERKSIEFVAHSDVDVLLRGRDDPSLHSKMLIEMLVGGSDRRLVGELAKILSVPLPAESDVPAFPVSGKDLAERGAQPGPAMGELLSYLKYVWKSEGYEISREKLLEFWESDREKIDSDIKKIVEDRRSRDRALF